MNRQFDLFDLADDVSLCRQRLVAEKIRTRNIIRARDEMELHLMVLEDYKSLGSNDTLRNARFKSILTQHSPYTDLRDRAFAAEDQTAHYTMELECAMDARRAAENTIYAQMADYLVGRVDHIGSAAHAAMQYKSIETIKEEVIKQ